MSEMSAFQNKIIKKNPKAQTPKRSSFFLLKLILYYWNIEIGSVQMAFPKWICWDEKVAVDVVWDQLELPQSRYKKVAVIFL